MRTKLFLMALATTALCVTSCSDNDDPANNANPEYISIKTSIAGSNASRTATQDDGTEVFTEGDVISVYAWLGEKNVVPKDLVVNNSLNTLTSGTWVANPQMLWQNMTASHYFLSVYPARQITDFTADPFTLSSTDAAANDLLVALNTTGLTATQNPVQLTFNHVMAKLVVNLSYRNQWGDTAPTVSSVVANAANAATINYLAASPVTASSTLADITLATTTANEKYTAVMVPQSTFQVITVNIDGKQYTYNNGKAISLASGKITTVNLIVGRDTITAESVTINDWQEGETINGGEAL
jgi:hypothetical protein